MKRGGGRAPDRSSCMTRPRRDTGFHLVDQIGREARAVAGITSLTAHPTRCARPSGRSCSAPPKPHCRRGSRNTSRAPAGSSSAAAETNIGDAIRKLDADPNADRSKPAWLVALEQARLPLYDVHWTPAVVVEKAALQERRRIRSGSDCATAASCRCRPRAPTRGAARDLRCGLRQCRVEKAGRKQGTRVELRVRPTVQGGLGRARQQDRPRARHGRRLLLPAKPAQPRHAVAPTARLVVQADDLSCGAQQRPAAQYAGRGRPDHAIRRSAAPTATRAPRTGGRRATTTATIPAR